MAAYRQYCRNGGNFKQFSKEAGLSAVQELVRVYETRLPEDFWDMDEYGGGSYRISCDRNGEWIGYFEEEEIQFPVRDYGKNYEAFVEKLAEIAESMSWRMKGTVTCTPTPEEFRNHVTLVK